MTDDLKSRLRKLEGGDKYGSTVWYRNPDGPEAVEYIEKLEAANLQQSLIKLDDMRRTEKLEAALREITSVSKVMAKSEDMAQALMIILTSHRKIALTALEGRDE